MQSIGKRGEDLAVDYLKAHGYEVVARNYRYQRGEVDIICRADDLLIFVEVKLRSSKSFGLPEDFVSENQQQKITSAAEQFMLVQEWSGDVRFDILAILQRKGQSDIVHFKDAFY